MGILATPFAACGPDPKPDPPCDGPTFNLNVQAEDGPVPQGTRINVRYGGNHDGETYTVGKPHKPQTVFCVEQSSHGGAASAEQSAAAGAAAAGAAENAAGAEGAGGAGAEVLVVACGIYSQGPARLDITTEGYESIEDQDLMLTEGERCQVPVEVVLKRMLDAGP